MAQMDDELLIETTEPGGLSWQWRIVIGLVAVIIIGAITYPLIRQRLFNNDTIKAEVSAENDTVEVEASAEEQFKLGNSHYQAGRWEQAIVAYQKALELDPNFQAAYANLGVTYYQIQQFDLAASQYEKALELNPNDGEVAYNLGVLYLQQALSREQGNQNLLQQAITQLQKAQQMSPQLAEPYFSLGVAYMALNQNDNAIQAFETYLSLASTKDSQAKQEAERYLQTLK